MGTETKTYDQLLEEVQALRQRVAELEAIQPEVGQASLDPLTGLLNKNGLALLGAKEIARTRRYGHPLSLILFDLDDFAALNNRYGHETGDLVLSRVAAVVGEQIRQPDFLFRTGGDEFLTLLPETDMKKAQLFAERLLATLAVIKFPLPGETISVTACAGAATFLFVEVELEALVAHAETALKEAKVLGKGSFSAYQE
jgi:diguanylate cyclase (GGDEF)-like protein